MASIKTGEKLLFGIFGVFMALAIISYVILEVIRTHSSKPMYTATSHYDFSPEGLKGSDYFRHANCTACHRALRNGTNMGLNLDGIGSRRTLDWIVNFLNHPEATYSVRTVDHGPGKEAAFVAEIPQEKLQAIAVFLSELRADRGAATAEAPPEGRSEFIDNMVKMWAPSDWNSKYQDVRTKSHDAPQSPTQP
jgi:hypothetical protein